MWDKHIYVQVSADKGGEARHLGAHTDNTPRAVRQMASPWQVARPSEQPFAPKDTKCTKVTARKESFVSLRVLCGGYIGWPLAPRGLYSAPVWSTIAISARKLADRRNSGTVPSCPVQPPEFRLTKAASRYPPESQDGQLNLCLHYWKSRRSLAMRAARTPESAHSRTRDREEKDSKKDYQKRQFSPRCTAKPSQGAHYRERDAPTRRPSSHRGAEPPENTRPTDGDNLTRRPFSRRGAEPPENTHPTDGDNLTRRPSPHRGAEPPEKTRPTDGDNLTWRPSPHRGAEPPENTRPTDGDNLTWRPSPHRGAEPPENTLSRKHARPAGLLLVPGVRGSSFIQRLGIDERQGTVWLLLPGPGPGRTGCTGSRNERSVMLCQRAVISIGYSYRLSVLAQTGPILLDQRAVFPVPSLPERRPFCFCPASPKGRRTLPNAVRLARRPLNLSAHHAGKRRLKTHSTDCFWLIYRWRAAGPVVEGQEGHWEKVKGGNYLP
jgi:hypothetical protein